MTELDDCHIRTARTTAARSPCRSKHGVALFDPQTGAHRGAGHNGPPGGQTCPGREICAGTCGQRSVHATMRALRDAAGWLLYHGRGPWDLVHLELAADGSVVACGGPSCAPCAREILDVKFVGGVWLYEAQRGHGSIDAWRRYTAEEFYCITLRSSCPTAPRGAL